MLPASHRLRHRRDFGVAVRRGRRAASGSVVAHLAVVAAADAGPEDGDTSGGAAPARVGFVVTGAVGSAVVRNRVRRRLRHLCAERLIRLPAGSLLVVRALPTAAGTPARRLAADLEHVLDRLLAGSVPGRAVSAR